MKQIGIIVLFATVLSNVWAKGAKSPIVIDWSSPQGILPARWESFRSGTREWTTQTFSSVKKDGSALISTLPGDYQSFCPELRNASNSERQNFYVYLLSSIAQLESNFNPNLKYRESFRDDQGRVVYSRGLLQISYQSSKPYGCGFTSESDLHSPTKNLRCGVKILDYWMRRDRRIAGRVNGAWRGGARYWAVLRSEANSAKIRSWTRDYCKRIL
ncbi:lytic transglycosylase domain-containing protein [bacterium]|nr:lytic transglycosylase domain-containing protein [bacterium]